MTLADRINAVEIQRKTRSILIFDVERTKGSFTGRFWSRGDFKNGWFPAEYVTQPPRIICWGARWYGSDEVLLHAEWQRGGHKRMIYGLWELIEAADIIVTHNGDNADVPWLMESLPQYGLNFPKPPKSVDTLKVMRSSFKSYHSKSLTETAKFLGIPLDKVGHWSLDLADRACAGDKEAQVELLAYQHGDVILQGAVYDGLRGYMPNHPHVVTDGDQKACNQCGSVDLAENGDVQKVVQLRAAWRCRNCGGNLEAGYLKRVATTKGLR